MFWGYTVFYPVMFSMFTMLLIRASSVVLFPVQALLAKFVHANGARTYDVATPLFTAAENGHS